MSMEYTYFRKYIILKNDYTNISNINPKGHAKLEVRGNKGIISFNLENCENEEYYRAYLLKERNGKIYEEDLGRIFTDERGKFRANINLNLKELESKGFSINKIDAILIRKGINVLLGGYVEKDNGTIDRLIKELLSGDKQEVHYEEPEAVDEAVEEVIDLHEEESEAIEEAVEEVIDLHEEEPEAIEEAVEEVFDLPKEEPETIEEVVEEVSDFQEEESHRESYESIEYARRLNHKNQMTNYILSILRFFPQVQPLKIYLHNYSWWRIEDDGTEPYRGFLPYYNYLMSADYKYPFLYNSATCMNQIKKYGHYLFGLYKEKQETKYYVYGVPGKFTLEEHPFRGITGFNTWYDSVDGVGYWVLYIDPITGKVIHPINPMVPSR
ncbi:hypothetical protein [Clostridium sp. Cult2]|uniref:hypothetical protein n=1 Tax=Clostridium sp. Cult2 TaxID=2079003 RepID=UPI001F4664B5|nr:hypothetical protein [Clostridium sp. Cult2]MCF6464330.1 hypothetical protein [Clostridium sp. Cult2]